MKLSHIFYLFLVCVLSFSFIILLDGCKKDETTKPTEIVVDASDTDAGVSKETETEKNNASEKDADPLKEFVNGPYVKLVQMMLKSDELEVEILYVDPTTAQVNFKLLKLTQAEKDNYESALEANGTSFLSAANNIKEKMLEETGLDDLKLICNFMDKDDNVLAKREF